MPPTREYIDIEVRLTSKNPNDKTYDVYAKSQAGYDTSDTFAIPQDAAFQALVASVEALTTSEAEITDLGKQLFRLLFGGKTRNVYEQTKGGLARHQRIRIRLNMDLTDPIAQLPWEYLFDPDDDALALMDTPIVRYIPQNQKDLPLKVDLPLRVLLTGGVASDLSVDTEIDLIAKALAHLEQQGVVEVVKEPRLTTERFQERLEEGFHVWHYVGHGSIRGDSAVLTFADDMGDPYHVTARELLILLRGSDVRLALLNACNTAKLSENPFRSLAPALIRSLVPAVVAMQFEVEDRAALAFVQGFYRALATGAPVDGCVTTGRKSIITKVGLGSHDWGIPVVYTRAPSGALFDIAQPATSSTSSSSATASAPNKAEKVAQINDVIKQLQGRLHQRELQKAMYGISADPSILMEIEDLKKQIAGLEKQRSEV